MVESPRYSAERIARVLYKTGDVDVALAACRSHGWNLKIDDDAIEIFVPGADPVVTYPSEATEHLRLWQALRHFANVFVDAECGQA